MNKGDLLCVKCTGEVVTFMSQDANKVVETRRGVQGRDGISYVTTLFDEAELELPEEYLQRKAEAYMLNLKMQKSVIGKKIEQLESELSETEPEVNPEEIPFKSRPN